jgi:hypothetical protein
MPNYQTLIDLALQQALAGGDELRSALLDATMTMEALVQSVFQQVAKDCADDPQRQSLLRRTFTVTLTNGVGTLPDQILTACITGSTVDVGSDPTIGPLMSFTPWVSFLGPSDNRLGYYSVRGDHEFYWVDPGDTFTPGNGRTGDINYTGPSVSDIPAASTDPVEVPGEIFSDLVQALATAVKGLVRGERLTT